MNNREKIEMWSKIFQGLAVFITIIFYVVVFFINPYIGLAILLLSYFSKL